MDVHYADAPPTLSRALTSRTIDRLVVPNFSDSNLRTAYAICLFIAQDTVMASFVDQFFDTDDGTWIDRTGKLVNLNADTRLTALAWILRALDTDCGEQANRDGMTTVTEWVRKLVGELGGTVTFAKHYEILYNLLYERTELLWTWGAWRSWNLRLASREFGGIEYKRVQRNYCTNVTCKTHANKESHPRGTCGLIQSSNTTLQSKMYHEFNSSTVASDGDDFCQKCGNPAICITRLLDQAPWRITAIARDQVDVKFDGGECVVIGPTITTSEKIEYEPCAAVSKDGETLYLKTSEEKNHPAEWFQLHFTRPLTYDPTDSPHASRIVFTKPSDGAVLPMEIKNCVCTVMRRVE